MSSPVARRYAQALHAEAERQDHLAATDEDVKLLGESLDQTPDLARFFRSPVISREKKKAIVEELFAARVSPLTHRFLQLLVDKERETLLGEVVEAYQALRDEERGIIEVEARTAHDLGAAERQKLSAAVERMTGKQPRLKVRREPSLMGGLVLRVGDTVYDGSVRHQLASLHEKMRRGEIHTNGHAQGDGGNSGARTYGA